jgi:5'(3')-deoxyribonucleotidase
MKDKKIVYVDMDGVLCDFLGASKKAIIENPSQKYPQSQWGFFLRLKEIPDAIESFKKLEDIYDVWILTRPSFQNVNCYTEKAQWVWDHLGFDVLKKTIMSPNKSLLKGDFLIDDMGGSGQEEFGGEWIHFKTEKFPDWNSVIKYLVDKHATS